MLIRLIALLLRLGWGLLLFLLIAAPWSVMMAVKAGPHYVYELVVKQNLQRATHAFDHVQPWYQYLVYMLGDFFPWVLLLPALVLHLRRERSLGDPARRFLLLAFLVPFAFLSAVQSKQGKYLLMGYPFLALLLGDLARRMGAAGRAWVERRWRWESQAQRMADPPSIRRSSRNADRLRRTSRAKAADVVAAARRPSG